MRTAFAVAVAGALWLIEGKAYPMAAANGLGSLVSGIVAVYLGMARGRAL